jgi:NitT/TauT family transport system ATP-binding protein
MADNEKIPAKAPLLELKDVEVEYSDLARHNLRLLDGISLAIHEDEVVAILGPSGSGKTSLVRVAAALSRPSAGQVYYRGEAMTQPNGKVGVVFQTPSLYPWMSVQQNVELGVENRPMTAEERGKEVAWAIDRIGLEGYEEAFPRELSSGIKTRVGLARALAAQPELLCLDDPFSGLDVFSAETLRGELLALWQNADVNPKALLLVTHNIQEAVELANRVLVLSGTPTRVKLDMQVPLPYPRNVLAQEFLDMVAQIHDLITRDVMPDDTAATQAASHVKLLPLPRAEIGQMIGLLEALADQGGGFDVFDFVAEARREYSSVLMVVNATEMLGLVRTPKDRVELTQLGRQFLLSDVNGRKMLVNLELQKLKLFRHVMEMLQRAPEGWLPRELVLEEFVVLLPSESPTRLLNTLIGWARYAELLGYSARRGQLYLDRIFVQEANGQISEHKSPKPAPRQRSGPKPEKEPEKEPAEETKQESSGGQG